MIVSGPVVKLGDNIDTDVILPGKYLPLTDPIDLSKHALEGLDTTFAERAKSGVVIVAGRNFGCGSSREQAPVALKYAGVKAVVAESFARIFFRNSVNIGLPILECKEIWKTAKEGDILKVDLSLGNVADETQGVTLKAVPLPAFMLEIIQDGGLIEHLIKNREKR
jgi:3-isopropylmalate/(R)-2-methylmalate dehydratase small subunit